MADIQHSRGVFQEFRTLSDIHLGSIPTDLPADTIVQFDGTTLKWGGEDYSIPLFRGAINAGWAVPVGDNVSKYIPKPAGIEVRSATSAGSDRGEPMKMGKAPDEDDVLVGTVEGSKEKTAQANKKRTAEDVKQEVVAADAQRKSGVGDLSDADQGVPVAIIGGSKVAAAVGADAQKQTTLLDGQETVSESSPVKLKKIVTKEPVAASKKVNKKVTWIKKGKKPKDRVKEAIARYGADKQAMEQVFKQETDQVCKMIKAEMKKK